MSGLLISLYSLVLILNIFFSFRKKPNRFVVIISIVFLIACVAGNVNNPDYFNYYEWYLGKWIPSTVEKGYILLSNFFRKAGFSYPLFLAITDLFSLGTYLLIIKKYNKEYHAFIALYMSYQIFLNCVQRRHTIATALLVLGMFLLANKKRMFYILSVICAYLIHKSLIIYLPFVFLTSESKFSKNAVRNIATSIVLACGLIFINGNQIPFLSRLSSLTLLDGKYERYFISTTHLGFILPWITHFMNVVLAYFSLNIVKQLDDRNQRAFDFCIILYYFVMLSTFALPLTMINEEFIRYFRVCNILVYLLFCQANKSIKYSSNRMVFFTTRIQIRKIDYYALAVINIITWLIIYSPSNVIKIFFSNNMWIN